MVVSLSKITRRCRTCADVWRISVNEYVYGWEMKKVHYCLEVSFFRKFPEQLELEVAGFNQSRSPCGRCDRTFHYGFSWLLYLPAGTEEEASWSFLSRYIHLVSEWTDSLARTFNPCPEDFWGLGKKRTKIVMLNYCCKKLFPLVFLNVLD